jgi:superfamily II RNA helicase
MEATFFSESDMATDRNGAKHISSEYPMWYNRQMLEELKEDITMAEFELKSGRIKDDKLPQARARLKSLQNKMEEVEKSMPKLQDKDVDKLAKVRKELGKEIASRMYSRSDMKKGLADAHEEVRRMETPSISLSPEMHELAAACNVKPTDGKVSRTQAEKIWKITSRYLDESSNTESLRRD